MMTPEGGGGGGHHHGGESMKKPGSEDHSGHKLALPVAFNNQLHDLHAAYEPIALAVQRKDLEQITAGFARFGEVLSKVDGSQLAGHPRMLWKEFSMLLGNDAVEGRDVKQMAEADRVFLLLKSHMRRMREQLGFRQDHQKQIEHISVPAEFQAELAAVWQRYLAIQQELAADRFPNAKESLASFATAVATVDDSTISGRAAQVWKKEKANLEDLIAALKKTTDIKTLRSEFKPLSEEIGVLAKSFGFGEAGPIYELHCPMAFQNKGAVWYQTNEQVRNPYFGLSMLKCADRVQKVIHQGPPQSEEHQIHLGPIKK